MPLSKLDKVTTGTENYRPVSLIYRCKNPHQDNSKLNKKCILRNIHHVLLRLISGMQGWFNIRKSIIVIYYIGR